MMEPNKKWWNQTKSRHGPDILRTWKQTFKFMEYTEFRLARIKPATAGTQKREWRLVKHFWGLTLRTNENKVWLLIWRGGRESSDARLRSMYHSGLRGVCFDAVAASEKGRFWSGGVAGQGCGVQLLHFHDRFDLFIANLGVSLLPKSAPPDPDVSILLEIAVPCLLNPWSIWWDVLKHKPITTTMWGP